MYGFWPLGTGGNFHFMLIMNAHSVAIPKVFYALASIRYFFFVGRVMLQKFSFVQEYFSLLQV